MKRAATLGMLAVCLFAGPALAADSISPRPFGAIATGTYTTTGKVIALAGTGSGLTPAEAAAVAIASCKGTHFADRSCAVTLRFNDGACGYVAVGKGVNAEGNRIIGHSTGTTRESAYAACSQLAGLLCEPRTIGFCTSSMVEIEEQGCEEP